MHRLRPNGCRRKSRALDTGVWRRRQLSCENALADYARVLEDLNAEVLETLDQVVAADVRFKDPFNDVHGLANMKAILADMFENISDIAFTVHETFANEASGVIIWTLSGQLRGQPWSVDGNSLVRFDAASQVVEHIDYWDAASGLYEHFPIIGSLLGVLRRRLSTDPSH